jgi:hypothetical protein
MHGMFHKNKSVGSEVIIGGQIYKHDDTLSLYFPIIYEVYARKTVMHFTLSHSCELFLHTLLLTGYDKKICCIELKFPVPLILAARCYVSGKIWCHI